MNAEVEVQTREPTPTTDVRPKETVSLEVHQPASMMYMNALFYGGSGVGKTTLVSTAQDVKQMADVLFVSIESGEMSIRAREDIDFVSITRYAQLNLLYEWARRYARARKTNSREQMADLEHRIKPHTSIDEIRKAPKCYRTIIIDSLTEVQKLCMYQLLGIVVGEEALDLEPEAALQRDWLKSAEMIRLLIRSFRNLAMNVLFVAGQNEMEDESKRRYYAPALPGKLSVESLGFLDVVGFMIAAPDGNDGDMRRRVFFRPTRDYHAKDRYHVGNTVKYIDDPTLDKFLSEVSE